MAGGVTEIRDHADTSPSCPGADGAHWRMSPIPSRDVPQRQGGTRQTPEKTKGSLRESGWAKESTDVGDGTFSTLAASGIIIRMSIVIRNRKGSKEEVDGRFELVNQR